MTIAAIALGIVFLLAGAFLVTIGWSGLRDNSDGALGLKASFYTGVALVLVAALILFTVARPAFAAPPENADPALAPFFGGLTLNGTSCCSISDCRGVPSRVGPGGWEAYISAEIFPGAEESQWVEVPNDKIVRGKQHPYGTAAACWSPVRGIMCFTEPTGA